MAASARVRQILSDVRALTDEETAELEAEFLADDDDAGRTWGEEIDRRASRVVTGETSGLDREKMRALFAMGPSEARAEVAALLQRPK